MSVDIKALVRWLREEVQPTPDICGRNSYRCAAHLHDGLYLPCVLFREENAQIDRALEKFEESRNSDVPKPTNTRLGHYPSVVRRFVIPMNSVWIQDIARVEPSRFSIPLNRLDEILGQTAMSWTQFTVVMDDGAEFTFGTTHRIEFFEMPAGYSGTQVTRIISHRRSSTHVYGPKPFFECFVPDAEFGFWNQSKNP